MLQHPFEPFPLLVLCAALAACGGVAQDVSDGDQGSEGTLLEARSAETSPNGATPNTAAPRGACSAATSMISDGEHSANQTNVVEGRGGYWYTYADSAGSTISPTPGAQGGSFEMTPGGANGTARAARMVGTMGTGGIVFVGMGMNFVDPKGVYDARRYQGIAFYAKKGSAEARSSVRLKLPDRQTDPDGRICSECFNDFGAVFEVTTDWQLFTFPFSELVQQPGWGDPHPESIDAGALFGVQFQVLHPGEPFDVWVDEIQFIGCR